MRTARLVAIVATLALATGVTGCRGETATPSITVDQDSALADQPVRVRASGLPAGRPVTIEATATDHEGRTWRGHATFTADGAGTVDLDRAVPTDGSYDGADGMGLFWSMSPVDTGVDPYAFLPKFPEVAPAFEVRVAVATNGREVASRTLRREWLATGVTHRPVRPETEGVYADVYLPPAGGPTRTPALIFGGSEGGYSQKYAAALLASHGHPAMSLAYFRAPGRPQTLAEIPLEYFVTAARLLTRQAGTTGPVAVSGYSRGSEAALLLAQHYPDLFRGAVLYAPNDAVGLGFPDPTRPAWTKDGTAIPATAIPVDRLSGPVLAIAGGLDAIWAALPQARTIAARVRATNPRVTVELLSYPSAGHGVGTFPFRSTTTAGTHPVSGDGLDLGGSPAADAEARRDGWPKVLAFLGALSGRNAPTQPD